MPTLLVWRGYKFRVYSSDGLEPPHIHIANDGRSAKIWLTGLDVEYAHGYTEREMRQLLLVVAENRDEWINRWNDFFGL